MISTLTAGAVKTPRDWRLRRRQRGVPRPVPDGYGITQIPLQSLALPTVADEAEALREQARHRSEQLRREAELEARDLESQTLTYVRRLRRQARTLSEVERRGARLHLDVEEYAARVRAEAARVMPLAVEQARREARRTDSRPPQNAVPAGGFPRRLQPRPARRHQAAVTVAALGALALAAGGLSAATGLLRPAGSPRPVAAAGAPAGTTTGAARAAALGSTDGSAARMTVSEVADLLQDNPSRVGAAGPALLGALRSLERLTGPARRNRALGLATDVEDAVRSGHLTPELERSVRPVLLREATPADVHGLVQLLEVSPPGAGPAGGALLTRLRALEQDPAPAQAAQVLTVVRRLAESGSLTSASKEVTSLVLDPLQASQPGAYARY